ncbi:hypothetical protein C8R45DRAFT_1014379 [Mycena sanguinolenta]|nr:hypothetical protein C8R45DRAFT_1014379 [Mycena sanguinolenta]
MDELGYGGAAMQDDPNVPSLVSIPYLGFMNATDPIYRNTRMMVLSTTGNPYYGATALSDVTVLHSMDIDAQWAFRLRTRHPRRVEPAHRREARLVRQSLPCFPPALHLKPRGATRDSRPSNN